MHIRQKQLGLFSAFAVLLVVLMLNSLITHRQLRNQVEIDARVEHTHKVLSAVSHTQSLLMDAETGQHGYLYTGDPDYLQPYNAAVSQVDAEVDRLAKLTADDPNQQTLVAQLRELVRIKLREMARTIDLYTHGRSDQAKRLVVLDTGRAAMDRIRDVIQQMEAAEDALKNTRIAQSRASNRRVLFTIYATTGVACIGLLLLALYILRSIAEREKHSAELRVREEWFRGTLSSIGDGVVATDYAGRIEYLNHVAEKLTGYTLSEARGKPVHDVFRVFHEQTNAVAENPVAKVLEKGHIVGLANHTVLQNKNGETLPIEDSAAPIRDDLGKIIGVVLVFRDATQERKAEEVLRRSEKLATAARLAATIAHEINNPLEALSNLLFLVKHTSGLPPAARGFVDSAEQQLERVSHVTRQTLGFYRESKIPEEIQLSSVVDDMVNLLQNKAKSKLVTLECDYKKCPSVSVVRHAMEQVVANLISNAVDAVPVNGTVRVSVASTDGGVAFTVADDGPGISTDCMPHIFEPFFTTKKDVGTGLGLWLSKQIVEEHGGIIRVSSSHNAMPGACFNVFLPCSAARKTAVAS